MSLSEKIVRLFAKSVEQHQSPTHKPIIDAGFEDVITSKLPWLKLDINIPHETILDEINNVENLLVEHRDQFGWDSFCIHGKSFDSTREDHYYQDQRPYDWTKESTELMPATVDYFKNIWPCNKYQRVRVMRLQPGAFIEVHKDHDSPMLGAINIAISQPEDCKFYVEGHGVVPFTVGSAYMIDTSNLHAVINNSDQVRYHIIIHQLSILPEFKNLVVNSYRRQYNI